LVPTSRVLRHDFAPRRPDLGFDGPIDNAPHPRTARSTRRATRLRGSAALLLVALLAGGSVACTRKDPAAGTTLPDVALSDLTTGDAASWPTDGKPVIINFWASWCTPCRAEMPAFDRVAARLGDRVHIVGVTDERNLANARKAAKRAAVSYPLYVDEDQRLLIDLNLSGLPGTVFVDGRGKVLGRHLGALTEAELTKEIQDRYGIRA
jgi:thiol-disulfide isomerase/thioredoxin